MTALSDALAAAQARAIASIGKGYVSGNITDTEDDIDAVVLDTMDQIGCTDKVEQLQLIACWSVLRVAGTTPPAEQKPSQSVPDRSKPTQAMLDYMGKLAKERNYQMPDNPELLTRDQAHTVIDTMKSGEYDPAAWTVPF